MVAIHCGSVGPMEIVTWNNKNTGRLLQVSKRQECGRWQPEAKPLPTPARTATGPNPSPTRRRTLRAKITYPPTTHTSNWKMNNTPTATSPAHYSRRASSTCRYEGLFSESNLRRRPAKPPPTQSTESGRG